MQHDSDTLFVGKPTLSVEKVPSTNKLAAELVSKTTPSEGTCIITDYQTAGEGQIGRFWFSDMSKNITLSYIFYPVFLKPTEQFYLSMVTSLAVAVALEKFCTSEVKVKWPNDIYIDDKKIAGILIQNQLQGNLIKNCIIGIGININQDAFPAEIPNPVSLLQINGKQTSIHSFLPKLNVCIEQYYLLLKAGKYEYIKNHYLGKLYRNGEWFTYRESEGNEIMARIIAVNPDGRLVLESVNAKVSSYGFREVEFIID